jgi:hypothetical protein
MSFFSTVNNIVMSYGSLEKEVFPDVVTAVGSAPRIERPMGQVAKNLGKGGGGVVSQY